MQGELREIPLTAIIAPEDFNPRSELGDLTDLAASIASVGVREPILVKDKENGEEEEFEIFVGFRRLAASKEAGKTTIPAIVHPRRAVTRQQMLILNVIENVQREDLNPVDEALALRRLQKEHGMSTDEICAQLGIKKSRVQQRFRLLKLTDVVREAVQTDVITVKAGMEIDRLPKEKQGKFVSIARELGGSRLKSMVDKELDKLSSQTQTPTKPKDPDAGAVTELVRSLKKTTAVVCNGLGWEDEDASRVKDINWRLLEQDDLKTIAQVFDGCADAVPDDIDVNEKAEGALSEMVEATPEDRVLDLDGPMVRAALINAVRIRAQELAIEKAEGGKRPRVTYAIAEEALKDFYANVTPPTPIK